MAKLVIRAIAIVLLLVFVGLCIRLIPAHLQVRAVNTPLPGAIDFLQLKRNDGPVNIYYINTSEQSLPASTLVHSVIVLEWSDGRLFLIDAGMRETQAEEFGGLMKLIMGAEEVEVHGAIGSMLGHHVAQVEGVGLTHLHIDHTEGIISLCEAVEKNPLLLQTNLQRDEHNFYTQEGADILADSCLTPAKIEGISILSSDEFPGLGMVALGGHTPGSTLFAAWLQDQLYVFSGDITNSKSDLIEDNGKGWVYSNLIVPEDTARTAQLRRWLRTLAERPDTTIVVSHDLSDFERSGLQPLR